MDTTFSSPSVVIDSATPHISEDDLILFAIGRLDRARFSAIDAHIALCLNCREELAGVAKFRSEFYRRSAPLPDVRRREHRIQTNDPGVLRVLNPALGQSLDVRVVDVSKSGLKLCAPVPLPVAGVAQVRMQDSVVLGEIRYCVAADVGFHAGIRIQGVQDFGSLVDNDKCLRRTIIGAYIRGEVAGDILAAINEHLVACGPCRETLAGELRGNYTLSARNPPPALLRANESGLLRTLDPFGPQLWEVGLLEVSRDGIRLRAPLPLAPGVTIQLFVHDVVLLAQVRSCSTFGSQAACLGIWIIKTIATN